MSDVEQLRIRLADVKARIDAVSDGRSIEIVAVTKTFPPSVLRTAAAAGLTDIGENYAQEFSAKFDELEGGEANDTLGLRWHFIGGMQSNKIKALGSRVWLWQTVDRLKLVNALASRVPGASILVQVNVTGETNKAGCLPGEAAALVERASELGLNVRGLMTVGPTGDADPRPGFSATRELAETLGLPELSMGMSGDFEAAIAEGATMVRLGSVLFGPRPKP